MAWRRRWVQTRAPVAKIANCGRWRLQAAGVDGMTGGCRSALGAISLLVAVLSLGGCTRTKYRLAADDEVSCLVAQKDGDPRWPLPNYTIEMDPRSRYYDPWNRDFPPMPPDDPAAHRFMHYVDGMAGWPRWHQYGDLEQLESPAWMTYLPQHAERAPDGSIRLSLDDCVRLSIIHDPDYQRQLETLYLSALDVSTERFRFDVQYFGNTGPTAASVGSQIPGGPTNLVTLASGVSVQKEFATAAQLMVGFANTIIWNFGGPSPSGLSTSLLNFSFVQPFLQGGGRVIALETLNIAERTLLYNIRAMIRYRQGNYTNVAIGELAVSGPSRSGGFFGGTGLTGFTGTGNSGFGGVGDITGFGRTSTTSATGGGTGSAGGFAAGGAGTVGGFIGLLQQITQIRNSQETLNSEVRALALLEANLEAGFVDITQVDQFRQNVESERALLLQARTNYQLASDTFLAAQMGLPPSLPVSYDESMIRQFQFIDPRLSALQSRIADAISSFGFLPKNPPLDPLRTALNGAEGLGTELASHFPIVRGDFKNLEGALPQRAQSMTEGETETLNQDRAKLTKTLSELETRLKAYTDSTAQLRSALTDQNRQSTADQFITRLVDLSNIAGELALVQARARLEQISVERIDLEPPAALEIARANRLDWMNNRASLVDTWRLIEFNANALKANLTVSVNGSVQSVPGHNPLNFNGDLGTGNVQLLYNPPFTRLVQRNSFRQQLIVYQQSRRSLIQFEDSVNRNLRQLLRDQRQLRINLEIQRRAMAIAIRRVDQTRENLSKPSPPAPAGAAPTPLGPTSAFNLLTALSDLRNAQNNFISVWIGFHADRMRILRELGLMQTTEDGIWIDESIADAIRRSTSDEQPEPPEIPREWLQEIPPDQMSPGTAPPAYAPPRDLPPLPPPAPGIKSTATSPPAQDSGRVSFTTPDASASRAILPASSLQSGIGVR